MHSKIMIVEDEMIISLDIKQSLHDAGYKNLFIADSGERCLELLKNDSFDLILMDIKLSGDINGIQASHLIKIMYDIPVIYITSYSDNTNIDELKQTEPYAYLVKPIDKNQLFSNIEIALYKHKTSRKLLDNKKTIQAILNSSGDLISLIDINGTILEANEQFAVYFKKPLAEILGTGIFELYPPETNGLNFHSKKAFQTGTPDVYEELHGKRYFENRLYPMLGDKGMVMRIAIYSRDITERKELELSKMITENIIRESEEKFRNLYNAMSQGVIYQDAAGKVLSFNESAGKILGLTPDQLHGREPMDPLWKSVDENGIEISWEDYPSMEALRTGTIIKDRIIGVYAPGENMSRWIKVTSIPEFNEGEKKPFRVFTTFEDITDIQNIKNDINFRLQFIQMLINSIPNPVYYKDTDLKYIGCNWAFEDFADLPKEKIIWRLSHDIFPKEFADVIESHETGLIKNTVPVSYESVINDLSGIPRTVVVNEALFHDLKGKQAGIIGIIMDITMLRNLEKELISAIDDERKRIGQDLHDSLGQKLTGLSFLLKALGMSLNDKTGNTAQYAEDIKIMSGIVADLIYQTRQLARGLNPLDLDNLNLLSALQDLADETKKIFRIKCSVVQETDFFIIDRIVISNIYFIVREAVNNAIKHGNPDEIIIMISDDGSHYKIEIMNNEKNIGKSAESTRGIGLKIMRYRADIIGAEFNTVRRDDGFNVSVKIKKEGIPNYEK